MTQNHHREQHSAQHQSASSEENQEQTPLSSQHPVDQQMVSEVDTLLDEINDLLQENAEDYVRGFVQKGGQ